LIAIHTTTVSICRVNIVPLQSTMRKPAIRPRESWKWRWKR